MVQDDSRPRRRGAPAVAALLLLAAAAAAQEGNPPSGGSLPGGPPPGSPDRVPVPREQMWPAPTAEDWAKPCLLTWQRTWEDALAVSAETGKPILICVNMDGEIASEHYAGVKYRQPEIAKLYEPYVLVVASVYRHTPRDHDDEGRRIPCPRFGTVTCGEHVAIEPVLYEKFFDGRRIAPRHLMIEVGGKETFDVFYANDTASVFQTIVEGIARREATPKVVVRGDRPVVERVASRDIRDREAVEAAYLSGDASRRRALLDAARKDPSAAPVDLLRLAVFGLDPDLARLAREALAKVDAPSAIPLLVEALRTPMEPAERDALIDALARLGRSSPRAQWLAATHQGLATRSAAVDPGQWRTAGGTYEAPPAARAPEVVEEEAAAREGAKDGGTADAEVLLELAESYIADGLALRKDAGPGRRGADLFAGLRFADARRMALRAEERGASGWRLDRDLAVAAYYAGETEEAYARAEAAVKALPPGEPSWNSMAALAIFAEQRFKAIKRAVRERRKWPPEWLADFHSAYTVLRSHPHGTVDQVLYHHEVLEWLGTRGQAARVLREGLDRFPGAAALHARARTAVLAGRGPEGLEAFYADLLRREGGAPGVEAFAAEASVAAAESLRATRRPEKALEAYRRALDLFERAAEAQPWRKEELDRAVALARAARARVAYERGDDDASLEEILASFARSPESAGDRDGLGFTPGETGQVLLARLRERERAEAASRLEEALGRLDPELLRPDRE